MRLGILAVLAACVLAGTCRGGDKTAVAPIPVPTELVPATLPIPKVTIGEDETARDAFTKVGKEALISDGRLWTIRRDDVLVATLQIATTKAKVDLTRSNQREAIASRVIPSSAPTVQIGDIDVQVHKANEKTTFVWFATDLFEVLQVKTTKLDAEDIVRKIIEFQVTQPAWHPLNADQEEVVG